MRIKLIEELIDLKKANESVDIYIEWCKLNTNRKSITKVFSEIKNMYYIFRSGLFDGQWYLFENRDVAESLMKNPFWKLRFSKSKILRLIARLCTCAIIHYVKHGVYESRNPNPNFNTSFYINNNVDILKEKNINPLAHYARFGINENRKINNIQNSTYMDKFCKYTYRCMEFKQNKNLKEKLSVIVGPGKDIAEMKIRLQSVYMQDYSNMEIIIIDNGESNEITTVINDYHNVHKDNTKVIKFFTQEKTKFSMWQKAMNIATSRLVWIIKEGSQCESKFISKLIPYFSDESIMSAYCPTIYRNGETRGVKKYSSSKGDYINTAFMEINEVKNYSEFIYEISSFIFCKPEEQQWYLDNKWDLEYEQVFTDFILKIIVGGKIASISDKLHKREAGKEKIIYNTTALCIQQQKLLLDLRKLYNVQEEVIRENYEYIRTCYLVNSNNSIEDFTKIYDIEEIMNCKVLPVILISIVAFTHGGGEIMPIRLANQLRKMGYPVIVHSYRLEETEEKVRRMLNSSIPVFETNNTDEMKNMLEFLGIRIINTHHQALQSFAANILNEDSNLASKINHVATSHGMYENFTEEIIKHIFRMIGNGVDYWTYVADKNIIPFKEHDVYDSNKFFKITNGMKLPSITPINKEEIGISEDAFLICTVSRAMKEKGWEEAIKSVALARQLSSIDIQLMLIGDGPVYDELMNRGVEEFVHLLGFKDNVCSYYAISDLCLLTSYYKSESAPLTIIEAILSKTPVIASNIGDIKQMLTVEGEFAGDIFDLDNGKVPIQTVAEKIIQLAKDKNRYMHIKKLVLEKGKSFDIKAIAEQYMDVFMKKNINNNHKDRKCLEKINKENLLLRNSYIKEECLKVSVIVPNYNHEKFLKQRLDSIYNQTYKNIEVILMDDCSKDNSREVLKEYAERYPEITKVLFNEKNSGGVFHQWKKGVESAIGDICWIAESDDYCDENFIEKLIPAFEDKTVKISYCKYMFIDSNGKFDKESFFYYVGEVDNKKWRASYVNHIDNEVEHALSIKNTIPNASGVLFRKPEKLKLFEDEKWINMKVCGDWIFYLNIAYGGKISYNVDTQSYFRFHNNNSSLDTYNKPNYYKEHEAVAYVLRELYDVSQETLIENYKIVKAFYLQHVNGDKCKFDELYNLKNILSQKPKQPQVVLSPKIEKNKIKIQGNMNTVLVNPIFPIDKYLDSSLEEKLEYVGFNTGNLLFVESMKEHLEYSKEILVDASEINKIENPSAVMPSSNFIIHGDDIFIERCSEFLNNSTCPVTLAGLGAQSTAELNTPRKLVKALTKTKINYFKNLSERAVSIGVRGEFTAQCLEEMGIYNYRIIGCPSAYKYFDGVYKKLKRPSTENVIFNVTTGKDYERKLLELGMSVNGKWIMQMATEMPEVILEGEMPNEELMQIRFPGIKLKPEELKLYMTQNANMFFRIDDWYDYHDKGDFSFAFGSRFHGNMSALRSGIPALWIVHDSRTLELVNTLHLPNIDTEKLQKVKNVEQLIELCDYEDFYKNYEGLTKEYVKFLDENNLKHKFMV